MATTFNKVYRKVANNGNSNDYQLVSMIGSDGVPVDIMKGATTTSDGVGGLMPTPTSSGYQGLLTNRGTYDDGSIFDVNVENNDDNVNLYMLKDKSDKIQIPSIITSASNGNTIGLMPKETKTELDKLPNGYNLGYDRAKIVYHSWNPSENNYNVHESESNTFKTETDTSNISTLMCRYDLKGNTSSQANPWLYPIFDIPDDAKRSRRYQISNYGIKVYPCHTTYDSEQWAKYSNGKNYYVSTYKMVFDVPGLYAVYSRFWVRSTGTSMKRMSLCPYINGTDAPRYRGNYCSYQGYNVFHTNVFFQYFNQNDTLSFGVFPEDSVSDSAYVSFAFADVAIYIISWDGQLSLTKS